MASTPAAVLIVNTGTPQAASSGAVFSYLRRFLSDPRVIELPRALWLPLLYGLVLPLRSPRSAQKYREIWRDEGSPLLFHNSRLREALARDLGAARGACRVEQAFLYSPPFVPDVLETLRAAGTRRLAVLPLYPQSSGATTGAVYDQVADGLRSWRAMPELRYVASYFDAPEYIDALAASVREHWNLHGRNGHLLMSFHGIPLSYVTRGDRYAEECHATAALLAASGVPVLTIRTAAVALAMGALRCQPMCDARNTLVRSRASAEQSRELWNSSGDPSSRQISRYFRALRGERSGSTRP